MSRKVTGLFTSNQNMEKLDLKLTEPRRKKCRAKRGKALPVPTKHDERDETELYPEIKICFGHLKEKAVYVNDLDEIKHLYLNGFYGKGLFSKGAPETLEFYCADEYGFLRSGTGKKQSNCEREAELKHEPLVLSLCEAFYLSHVFGVLVVQAENGEFMSLKKMWKTFRGLDEGFVAQYAAYRHFRNKGWVVRSGVKYGVDFVLYKEGPPFYHSSYSVLVCPASADDSEANHKSLPRDWTEMSCLVRVTEQVAKELLACVVLQPPNESLESPACVDDFKIFEVMIKRWVSKKEREEPEEGGH